jgi:LysM repeat protein
MGLFSFVRDAGKKLFGGGDDPAEAIQKEVAELGLEGDVEVTVEGDKVVIAGSAPSQELREKIILAAGNVEGIASVEDNIQPEDTSGAADFHTVEKGDTLWAVSQESLWRRLEIHEDFRSQQADAAIPDKIYPGQVLRIPADG